MLEGLQGFDIPEKLSNKLESIGDSDRVQVQVYRRDRSGTPEFLETVDAGIFDLEWLRENHGGGRFQVKFLHNAKYVGSTHVSVAGPPRVPPHLQPEEEKPEPAPEPAQAPAGDGGAAATPVLLELARTVAGLQEEFRRIREEIRNPPREAERQNPADLTLSILGAVQESVRPYQEALLDRARAEREEESGLFGSFLKGVEFGRNLGSDTGYQTVVNELGKPLLRLLQGDNTAPGPGGDLQPVHVRFPDDKPRPRWAGLLQRAPTLLPQLIRWASEGEDAQLRAAMVTGQIPLQEARAIAEEIGRDDFPEEFFGAVPAAQAHRPWFEEFFNAMRSEFGMEPEPSPD